MFLLSIYYTMYIDAEKGQGHFVKAMMCLFISMSNVTKRRWLVARTDFSFLNKQMNCDLPIRFYDNLEAF